MGFLYLSFIFVLFSSVFVACVIGLKFPSVAHVPYNSLQKELNRLLNETTRFLHENRSRIAVEYNTSVSRSVLGVKRVNKFHKRLEQILSDEFEEIITDLKRHHGYDFDMSDYVAGCVEYIHKNFEDDLEVGKFEAFWDRALSQPSRSAKPA